PRKPCEAAGKSSEALKAATAPDANGDAMRAGGELTTAVPGLPSALIGYQLSDTVPPWPTVPISGESFVVSAMAIPVSKVSAPVLLYRVPTQGKSRKVWQIAVVTVAPDIGALINLM